jgi:sugar/nucleoside kinase (ribokinase family)
MMLEPSPIDYLIIGHVAMDISTDGHPLGGTVSYAGRTALSMGYRVGAITSCRENFDLSPLEGIQIIRQQSPKTTTFENTTTSEGRKQRILEKATDLDSDSVPIHWRSTKLVHLGPIACEVKPTLIDLFPSAFIGITPQGWLRSWGPSGHIRPTNWKSIEGILPKVDAVVLSIEDLMNDEDVVKEMAQYCRVLAVTRAAQGASVFWDGKRSELPTIELKEIDATGAGDIFAAVFFICLYVTGNPYEAGQLANRAASKSITRKGIQSTPTTVELETVRNRVLP